MRATALLLCLALVACGTAAPRPTPARPHAASSVAWQPWEASTFARAQSTGRLLLVSVKTEWCHWCHVMDEETWSDPRVAALLAARFVAVRVDADARPDVAERYADWAWPATALLTSDAQPILELRGYRDADTMLALLEDVVAKVDAGRPVARVVEAPAPPADADLAKTRDLVLARLDGFYDDAEGGWGRPQKYPLPAPVEHALLRAALYSEDERRARAVLTATKLRALVDPVDGGVYQYSLRGVWTRPHYERLAEIQAGAIDSFARAAWATGDAAFLDDARRVVGYVTTTLRGDDGAFFANQDADLGTRGDYERIPGDRYFAMSAEERARRGTPYVDRNVYASHNGAIVAALARYAIVSGDEAALRDAERAARRILSTHRVRGGFAHAAGDDDVLHLLDQVRMGRALLALEEATGDPAWIDAARATAELMLSELHDDEHGAFFAHTEQPGLTGVLAVRRKPFRANGEAARFLLALGRRVHDERYVAAARRALVALSSEETIREEGRHVGEVLLAIEEFLVEPVHFTLVAKDGVEVGALREAALRAPLPHRVVEREAPGGRWPDLGEPALFLCTSTACSPPITDPAVVAKKAVAFSRR